MERLPPSRPIPFPNIPSPSSLAVPAAHAGRSKRARLTVPVQDEKAQQLYDAWQAEVDCKKADRDKRMWFDNQQSSRITDSEGRLPSPSPSQATEMSRASSYTGIVQGIVQGMQNTVLEDRRGPPSCREGRRGRSGPMNTCQRAEASFRRYSKSICEACRKRKVKCDHFDLSIFEARYQPQKEIQRTAQFPGEQALIMHNTTPSFDFNAAPRTRQPTELLGVGIGPSSSVVRRGGDYADPDDLLDPLGGIFSNAGQQGRRLPFINVTPFVITPASPPPGSLRPPSVLDQTDQTDVPIGKEFDSVSGIWRCGYEGEGTRSGTSVTSMSADACAQVFMGVDNVKAHYKREHGGFEDYFHPDSPYMWRCVDCDQLHRDPKPRVCDSCRSVNFERQYHGWISNSRSVGSGEWLPVAGPATQPTWSQHNPWDAQSQNSTSNPSMYRLGRGEGTPGQSYQLTRSKDGGAVCEREEWGVEPEPPMNENGDVVLTLPPGNKTSGKACSGGSPLVREGELEAFIPAAPRHISIHETISERRIFFLATYLLVILLAWLSPGPTRRALDQASWTEMPPLPVQGRSKEKGFHGRCHSVECWSPEQAGENEFLLQTAAVDWGNGTWVV